MRIEQKRVQEFLDDLASSSATPGGGSAAALVGAMAAGLVSMVCNVTIGKNKFADVEAEMQETLKEAESLRQRLTKLAEADINAFNQVMTAYRLPKETDEEQSARQVAIQSALKQATQTPLETAIACATILQMMERILPKINPNALSDGAAAASLAEAGLQSARLNVVVNLSALQDANLAQETQNDLEGILQQSGGTNERIFAYVLEHL